MPSKSKVTTTTTALAELTKLKGRPRFGRNYTENEIVNRIRIADEVTLTSARKLLKAAIRKKCISVVVGVPPGSPRGEDEHPLSPNFFYDGPDVNMLEHLLIAPHTMLNCSATICYGDGGQEIESDEDAEEALKIILENYREPQLCLYF